MSLITLKAILFILSLMAAALLAYLETAFTALRLFKVKELARRSRFKKLFECWEENPKRILITILIASALSEVLASVLTTDLTQAILGDNGIALAIGVFLATGFILVFSGILPKSFAKGHHSEIPFFALVVLNFLYILLSPVVLILNRCAEILTKRFGGDVERDTISEREIEFLIDYGDEKGLIAADKSEMLQNIFSLGDTLAKEIMIPALDMVALNADTDLNTAMEMFSKYRFTRFPVYENKDDNFIGIIHQKDIFDIIHRKEKKPLRSLVMPVMYVPETKKVNQLLNEFLKKRAHMAIVVNEHGEVTGLVTLEDVIEEIVGEISDEHETVHQEVVPLEDGEWMVDARVTLEKLEEALKVKFSDEESVTLGGFLAEQLQHVPKKGERVFYEGYCFQVQSASAKRVHQVLVFKDQED